MGRYLTTTIAYGYDLGSDEDLAAAEENGNLRAVDWYDSESEGDDFAEQLCAELFRQIPHQHGEYRDAAVRRHWGVEINYSFVQDYTGCLILTPTSTQDAEKPTVVSRDCTAQPLDLSYMVEAPGRFGWDSRLRRALDAVGLRPHQQRAEWLLFGSFG